jgi:hypothetical protein
MRCLACGEEMQLLRVVRDDTDMFPSFAQQLFQCPACSDVDRRLVIQSEPVAESEPADTPPAMALPADQETQSTWTRALDRLSRKQAEFKEQDAIERSITRLKDFNLTWKHFIAITLDRPLSQAQKTRLKAATVAKQRNVGAQPTVEQLVARLRTRKIVELGDEPPTRHNRSTGISTHAKLT